MTHTSSGIYDANNATCLHLFKTWCNMTTLENSLSFGNIHHYKIYLLNLFHKKLCDNNSDVVFKQVKVSKPTPYTFLTSQCKTQDNNIIFYYYLFFHSHFLCWQHTLLQQSIMTEQTMVFHKMPYNKQAMLFVDFAITAKKRSLYVYQDAIYQSYTSQK